MLVTRTEPLPIECVARGYLSGSGWKDYAASGELCGIRLRARAAFHGELRDIVLNEIAGRKLNDDERDDRDRPDRHQSGGETPADELSDPSHN